MRQLSEKIFSIRNENDFEKVAMEVFRHQASENLIYKSFLALLKFQQGSIQSISDIPFLPIELFKSETVVCKGLKPKLIFESSGTTDQVPSKHFVADPEIYHQASITSFENFYGSINDYCILALLPSYLERKNSSLVYMIRHFMNMSESHHNGFYLHNYENLYKHITELESSSRKILLIGVTFALAEFAQFVITTGKENFTRFSNLVVMETGGMKGRGKEWIRQELHDYLAASIGVSTIHSEYGMTELLSQSYSTGKGLFQTPSWMKVIIKDVHDPFSGSLVGESGRINIIDLANINSCSFIATDDLGRKNSGGYFEVLGRLDYSDQRGCSLMIN